MKKYCLLWVFSSFLSLAASSFYTEKLDERNADQLTKSIKAILPANAVDQRQLEIPETTIKSST
ncbi:MAG: hypothetical protein WCJ92_06615, partial [Alphaproteobacteria bacterium]